MGDYLQQIAQLFDRNHFSLQSVFVWAGGIRLPPRTRSKLALILPEREVDLSWDFQTKSF